VQVVDALLTTGLDIEATNPAPPSNATAKERKNPLYAGGYRLKKDALGAPDLYQLKQLAQYTAFWHHNVGCYGTSTWVKNPAQDTGSAKAGATRPAGTADPTEAFYASGSAAGSLGGGGTSNSTVNGRPATITYYWDPATNRYIKETLFKDAAGGVLIEELPTGGGTTGPGSARENLRTGRLSWREVIR
jgi:hypothetical protein